MPTAKIYLPKQWTDWTTWLLGIWLCLSPWTLLFEFEATATRNAVLLGVLIILAELVELSIFRGWEEWINVALGAWLVASTWVLGIATISARINFIVVGGLVAALALYEMRQMRQNRKNMEYTPTL
ncbi:MAG: SPW repeat protein [Beijerinckiaceae bacterium]